MLQTGSATPVSFSAACPSTTSLKLNRNTPCEPTMLLLSRVEVCSGKSLMLSMWFGPKPARKVVESAAGKPLPSTRRKPGSIWLLVRLSAPALKWQVAQAVLPSLPNCISQKNAFPRAIAAFFFFPLSPPFPPFPPPPPRRPRRFHHFRRSRHHCPHCRRCHRHHFRLYLFGQRS